MSIYLMANPVRYLNAKNGNKNDDWAFLVYNTLRDPQEDIIINEKGVNVLHSCLTPAQQKFPVIAREEYRLIWEYASTALADYKKHGHGGLVVYGQPGIGKSLFLLYALAHAIKAKIPVAWCMAPTSFHFFDENGVSRRDYSGVPLNCKLALFDTVQGMESPVPIFYGRHTSVFVIQATSPKLSRWKEWSKQTNAELWAMDIWNATEIDYLRKLKPTKEEYYDPVAVSTYLGPSARYCAMDFEKSGDPIVDFAHWEPPSFKDSDVLFEVLEEGTIEDKDQHNHFHNYFFVTPNPTRKRPVKALLNPKVRFILPTDFLRNRIFDGYCSQPTKELKKLCRKFSPFPQICGAMFEVFAVKKLWLFQEALECHFPNDASFELPAGLKPIRNMLSADTPANTVWVVPTGYPTVDAVAVTSRKGKKCITFFQMTIAKAHGIKPESITKIWSNFENVYDMEWRFVFVVPSEDIGKRLWRESYSLHPRRKSIPPPPNAQKIKRKHLSPLPSIDIPVGYTVVDSATKEQREEWAKAFLWGGGEIEEVDDEVEPEYEYVDDEQIDNGEA